MQTEKCNKMPIKVENFVLQCSFAQCSLALSDYLILLRLRFARSCSNADICEFIGLFLSEQPISELCIFVGPLLSHFARHYGVKFSLQLTAIFFVRESSGTITVRNV